MSTQPPRLLVVTDPTVNTLLAADRAVLVLTRAGYQSCAAYCQDIQRLLLTGQLAGVTVGELRLDLPGAARFKQANPWLRRLQVLPYTVLYRRGTRVEDFAAARASFLLQRVLHRLFDE